MKRPFYTYKMPDHSSANRVFKILRAQKQPVYIGGSGKIRTNAPKNIVYAAILNANTTGHIIFD